MGLFRSVRRAARKVGGRVMKTARTVTRSPLARAGVSFIPGGGALLTGASLAVGASSLMGGPKGARGSSGGGGYPVPPMMVPGMSKMRGVRGVSKKQMMAGTLVTPGTGGTGILPKGPGGGLQWPWKDPNTPEFLRNFALDDQYLRVYYRAPKGFVVVRDEQGRPYPMLRWAAQKFGLWSPQRKPPISVGEHQAIVRADRAVKKIRKVMTRVSRVDRSVSKGKVCIKRKKR